jgi:hypothetical protein
LMDFGRLVFFTGMILGGFIKDKFGYMYNFALGMLVRFVHEILDKYSSIRNLPTKRFINHEMFKSTLCTTLALLALLFQAL